MAFPTEFRRVAPVPPQAGLPGRRRCKRFRKADSTLKTPGCRSAVRAHGRAPLRLWRGNYSLDISEGFRPSSLQTKFIRMSWRDPRNAGRRSRDDAAISFISRDCFGPRGADLAM